MKIIADIVKDTLTQWGHDRRIDPELLSVNTIECDSVDDGLPFDEQLEALLPTLRSMGETIEKDSLAYATKKIQKLRDKYGSGGFTIEGIDPTNGEASGYPRFRPVIPLRYQGPDGKIKEQKYISRGGSSSKDFYARVPLRVAQWIADRYGVEYDRPDGDYQGFWQWVRDNRIPLILAEGEGDAMAVLSRGYVAVGIPGHHMAFQKGTTRFRPEFSWLIANKPEVILAFDRDEKPKTIAAVQHSRSKVSNALDSIGITAKIAYWHPSEGKGAGDIADEALDKAIENANPIALSRWQLGKVLSNPWDGEIDYVVTSKEELEALHIRLGNASRCVIAATGRGKTEAMAVLTADRDRSYIAPAPLRSLTYGVAAILDLAVFNDGGRNELDDRVSPVINSLHKIKPLRNYGLIFDEFEQSLDSLYHGPLNRQNRSAKIADFESKVMGAEFVALASATALPFHLQKIESIRGERFVRILFKPANGFSKSPITIVKGNGEEGSQGTALHTAIGKLEEDIRSGASAIVACDTASKALEVGELAKTWGIDEQNILIYCSHTLSDPRVQSFRRAKDKGQWLAENAIIFLAYSPIMRSGDSIKDWEGVPLFDARYAFVEGATIAPADALQFINRYRSSTPITIVLPQRGKYTPIVKSEQVLDDCRELGSLLARDGKYQISNYALAVDRLLALQYQHFSFAFELLAKNDEHPIEVIEVEPDDDVIRQSARDSVREIKALPIVNAKAIDGETAKLYAAKPELTPDEQRSLDAFRVRKFFGMDWDAPLSIELVLSEGFGRESRKFSRLLSLAIEGYARDLDLEIMRELGENPFLHDLPINEARIREWEALRVPEIISYCVKNEYSRNDPTLRNWWDTLLSHRDRIEKFPRLFGFRLTLPDGDDDGDRYAGMIKTIGTLLNFIGFKTASIRSAGEGRIRVYRVTAESVAEVQIRFNAFLEESGMEGRAIPLVRLLLEGVALPLGTIAAVPDKHPKTTTNGTTPKPDPHIQT